MPAAKPITARRPPARAPTATAPLDVDEEVADAALPDADPEAAEGEPDEPVVFDGVPSGDDALAAAWNASKVLFAEGLTAKTMPDVQ